MLTMQRTKQPHLTKLLTIILFLVPFLNLFARCKLPVESCGNNYKGQTYHVCLKVPILAVICDSEGADKLCGKSTNRNLHVSKICCYCDCNADRLDHPGTMNSLKLKHTSVWQIQSINEKGDSTMLALNSCYPIKNAFHMVTFADVERGINGSTPAEQRLHWFLIGLAPYLIEGLYNLSKMLQSRSANARSRATRSIPNASRHKSTKHKHPPGTSTFSSSDEDDDEEDDEEDPSPDFFYQHLFADHTGILRDYMFPLDHMLSDTTSVFTKDVNLIKIPWFKKHTISTSIVKKVAGSHPATLLCNNVLYQAKRRQQE
jgi:hypothetical protein